MNSRKNYVKSAIAALSGASVLALSMSQASALTPFGSPQPVASVQVELAGWHGDGWRDGGHHGGYWGHGYWGHGYGWGPGYGYWGSGYWGHPYYPPGPCSIFGGSFVCPG